MQERVRAPRPPLRASRTERLRLHRERIRAHYRPHCDALGDGRAHSCDRDAARDEMLESLRLPETQGLCGHGAGKPTNVLPIDADQLLRCGKTSIEP